VASDRSNYGALDRFPGSDAIATIAATAVSTGGIAAISSAIRRAA
jgi:hypothetical protein